MHMYDSSDNDVFSCDECDSEIFGSIFNSKGKQYRSRVMARSGKKHYCAFCSPKKEIEA